MEWAKTPAPRPRSTWPAATCSPARSRTCRARARPWTSRARAPRATARCGKRSRRATASASRASRRRAAAPGANFLVCAALLDSGRRRRSSSVPIYDPAAGRRANARRQGRLVRAAVRGGLRRRRRSRRRGADAANAPGHPLPPAQPVGRARVRRELRAPWRGSRRSAAIHVLVDEVYLDTVSGDAPAPAALRSRPLHLHLEPDEGLRTRLACAAAGPLASPELARGDPPGARRRRRVGADAVRIGSRWSPSATSTA